MIHRIDEQRECSREHRSEEDISGHNAGCVSLKSIDEVVQGTLEDGEEAKSHQRSSNAGRYPLAVVSNGGRSLDRATYWYAFFRGPAEEEEASSYDNRGNHRWRKSGFWNSLVAVRDKSTIIIALIQNVCSSTDKDTDQ